MENVGTITLQLENVSLEEVERFRAIIDTMFIQGVFSIRNGKAILHFDGYGTLSQISFDFIRWKVDKASLPLANQNQPVKIKTTITP